MPVWMGPAIFALVCWGVTGVTQKLSTNRISYQRSFVWFALAFVPLSAAVAAVCKLDWRLSPAEVAWCAAGGFLNGLGALTSFAALASGGRASIVIPLVSLYPLVTVAGCRVFLGETISARQAAGAALAIVAAILLSQEPAPAATERGESK